MDIFKYYTLNMKCFHQKNYKYIIIGLINNFLQQFDYKIMIQMTGYMKKNKNKENIDFFIYTTVL